MNLNDFHFTQPLWLLMIIPVIIASTMLWRRQSREGNWQQIIDPNLLPFLISGLNQRQRGSLIALLVGWLLACVALAGPSWEKLPQPLLQKQDALVILLDLSYSMYAQDLQPSRLVRARQKIIDLLQRRKEGLTALVSYAGNAHVVSPLTDDVDTIANLVPALSPNIMPSLGSNPAAALKLGFELLKNSELKRGRILLISDSLSDADVSAIRSELSGKSIQLSLLAVGTAQGAPIPIDNGFMRDSSGTIVVPSVDIQTFQALASATGSPFSELQLDDSDLNAILPTATTNDDEVKTVERSSDQWRNRGPWLVMLLLPLAALGFRRGWLLTLLIAPMFITHSPTASALTWQDLWKTPDQQGAILLEQKDPTSAASAFRNPQWKGSSFYEAGDYKNAAEQFRQAIRTDETGKSDYNLANSLAKMGEIDEAIEAYKKALKKNPQLTDAEENIKLLEELKKQDEKKQKEKNEPQKPDCIPSSDDTPNIDTNNGNETALHSARRSESGEIYSTPNTTTNKTIDRTTGTADKQSESSKPEDDCTPPQNDESKDQQAQNQESKDQQSKDQQASKNQKDSEQGQEQQQQQAEQDKQNQEQQKKEQEQAADGKKPDEQKTEEEKAAEQAQQAAENQKATDEQKDEKKEAEKNPAQLAEELAKQQQQQATEQWLRQIPDDPGGLMQRKFQYEYEQRRNKGDLNNEDQQPW